MRSNDWPGRLAPIAGSVAVGPRAGSATLMPGTGTQRPEIWRALATALIAALATASVAVGIQMRAAATRPATATVGRAAGAFVISNSKDGQAIFVAQDMGPGSSTSGQTTIANGGQLAGSFELSAAALADQPGPGGGRLSDLVTLVVTDITRLGAPVTVYAGKLATMPNLPLGEFGPGEARTYDFAVSLPRNAINAYQSSALQVDYTWTGTAIDPTGKPSPPPASPPPVTTAPSPGPGGGLVVPTSPSGPPTVSPRTPEPPAAARRPGTKVSTGAAPSPRREGGTHSGSVGGALKYQGRSPRAHPGGGSPARHTGGRVDAKRSPARTAGRHHDRSTMSSILAAVIAILRKGAFPFLLLLIMVGFSYVQNWLDKRDPKLALAPVEPEPLRSFD